MRARIGDGCCADLDERHTTTVRSGGWSAKVGAGEGDGTRLAMYFQVGDGAPLLAQVLRSPTSYRPRDSAPAFTGIHRISPRPGDILDKFDAQSGSVHLAISAGYCEG